jgi:quinol-cytochrome oxidoreductase complex cytochrome b subunit
MSDITKSNTGGLKGLWRNFIGSWIRHGYPDTPRNRSLIIFSNLFFHMHSVRVHKNSLRATYTFGLGLISFFLFLVLCVTGVILMVYYVPAPEQAYLRVKDLEFVIPGGMLIRNLHRWSAHGMVAAVILHMVRVFYTASYKNGREFNWVVGIVLLALTLGLSYSGYLLPWDQLAYWAVTIGANIAASPTELTDVIGITEYADIGGAFKRLLLGGNEVGADALIRFYVLHCVVLPIAAVIGISLHFWRIRKDGGLSRPGEEEDQ